MTINFLFKLWIFEIDFTTVMSFLLGIFFGALIICMLYGVLVLATLRNKKFLIKSDTDSFTVQNVKQLIVDTQKAYKDKDLRGSLSRTAHCKNLCFNLVYGIATKFYPKSKYPLLELSVDETLMLTTYIERRIEEILNRKGIRLLKKIKVSTIFDFSQKTSSVVNSKAFKVGKNASEVVSTAKKIINLVNPAWWFRKIVIDKTINIITNKLCLVVIAIVGEETYKIYSKTVFNKVVEIESNVDALLESIDKDFMAASNDIQNENFDNKTSEEIVIPAMNNYKLKTRSYLPKNKTGLYQSIFMPEQNMKKHYQNENKCFLLLNNKYALKEEE